MPKSKKSPVITKSKAKTPVKRTPQPKAASKPVVVIVPPPNRNERLLAFCRSALFARIFVIFSVGILLLTTLFWTVLSAHVHQANADQLIDAYLFENGRTFQGAQFPGAHSFLLKWPIFALMHLYGNLPEVFLGATVIMVLLTVGLLVYLLYRIERRPIVFGLLCLALSSVLLLVPAQPLPGTLLPVNMAMSTTRNLEYAVFLVALYLAGRMTRLKSWTFAGVAVLLGLVIASDKLFAVLAVGGALLAATWYILVGRNRMLMLRTLRVTMLALLGMGISSALLWVVNYSGFTNLVSEQVSSPYPLIQSVRQLVTGMIYGFMGILTNFGANPVHAVVVVQELPRAVLQSFKHLSIVAYSVNLTVLLLGLYFTARAMWRKSNDSWSRLAVLLVGSAVTAGAVFVLTDHYYPVDARYLTICLFAVFIAAATYLREVRLRPAHAVIAGLLLAIALPIGLLTSWNEYQQDVTAMAGRSHVTNRVSDELHRRKIDRLIGNYWDITPIKAETERHVTISPVDSCVLPRPVLNSSAWFQTARGTSTAYLAVRDGSSEAGPDGAKADVGPGAPATYGGCSLARVVGSYGVPSERVSIAGTTGPEETPDVLLLLYPGGVKPPLVPKAKPVPVIAKPKANQPQDAGPPQPKSFVPFTEKEICSRGTTLQVVAHQDDDLLFMNPDLLRSIKDGRCIRTVYVTAGDSGEQVSYWGSRELGAKAAYAQMYGVPNTWQEDHQLLAGRVVTVEYLADIPEVSLVFLRLPDGNLRGEGFLAHEHQSLRHLLLGEMSKLETVEGNVAYTQPELVAALLEIMNKDVPDQIRTQGSSNVNDGDHSDHHAVGQLTDLAAAQYLQSHTVTHYLGYPEKDLPINLTDDDITLKQTTFLTYAKFDGAVCQTAFECQGTNTYGSYLTRQYLP